MATKIKINSIINYSFTTKEIKIKHRMKINLDQDNYIKIIKIIINLISNNNNNSKIEIKEINNNINNFHNNLHNNNHQDNLLDNFQKII